MQLACGKNRKMKIRENKLSALGACAPIAEEDKKKPMEKTHGGAIRYWAS
jgi:hypothetical protein